VDQNTLIVMAGLVPAIHVFAKTHGCEGVDARDKRGQDAARSSS
jgi:hypothetical protein